MAHRALIAGQQGCLRAIKGHPPVFLRHALLKPHWSSQGLRTCCRRSVSKAGASGAAAFAADEAAANSAAARDDKASEKSPSSPDWLSNLPEDVQYDFIIFQIRILKLRLDYVRNAAKGLAYLPGDTEESYRSDFDEECKKLW